MKPYYQDEYVTIYNKDCRDMSEVKDNSASLVITSPPYHVGKDYEDFLRLKSEYFSLLKECWMQLNNKLQYGTTLVCNIAHNADMDTPSFISVQLTNLAWNFVDNIIWQKPDAASPRFGTFVQNPYATFYTPNHTYEHLLIYSKGTPRRTRETAVSLEYAKKFRGDIWRINSETNSKHEAPFPEELVAPLIILYSNTGELILDPFLGSGTTCFVAKRLGRISTGYEKEERYCELAAKRCCQSVMELKV